MRNLKKLIVLLTSTLVLGRSIDVSGQALSHLETSQSVALASSFRYHTVYYSRSIYNLDTDPVFGNYNPFPNTIYVTLDGCLTYMTVDSWYVGPTDYVVTYKGIPTRASLYRTPQE